MSFSIIAIKTGKRPTVKFQDPKYQMIQWDYLKVLKENTIYKLNNSYTFKNNDFTEIEYEPSTDINIFEIKSDKKTLPLSVQAVVGGNGSGKSTLLELIYWANYNIGAKLNLFDSKYMVYADLDFELFYRTAPSDFYLLKFFAGEIIQSKLVLDNKTVKHINQAEKITSKKNLKDFFYSIILNYSHYALNEMEVGSWVHPLFHKNDGYQTPMVLNPKREKKTGINVETERKLVSRRLQALALEPVATDDKKGTLRDFGGGKIGDLFTLTFDAEYHLGPYNGLEETKSAAGLLAKAIEKEFEFTAELDLDDSFDQICINYILGKMVKMALQYPQVYGRFVDEEKEKLVEETTELLEDYLKVIKSSSSHIAFKVKGAILYLKHKAKIFGSSSFDINKQEILIDTLSGLVVDLKKSESFFINTFMLTPPSFFRTEIHMKDGTTLDSLSSGERQRIHSISSLLYHIVNLNSVEELKLAEDDTLVRYKYINLILDEIELYYHPDWQRLYVYDLISGIEKLNPDKLSNVKGINVTFLTHSPFILSDIPSNNVLRLEEGFPKAIDTTTNSFGANIHDLLAHEFFMKNGFMGEFAKLKINEVIKFLTHELNKLEIDTITKIQSQRKLESFEEHKLKYLTDYNIKLYGEIHTKYTKVIAEKTINMVGDPLLRNKLIEMLKMI